MGLPCRPPEPEDAPTSGCSAALLEAETLARRGSNYSDHLSVAEREWYRALRTEKRRSEWLAGRLAAKYLFLNRLELGEDSDGREWPPRIIPLSAGMLEDFPASLFRAVELYPSRDPGGGPPWLQFYGRRHESAVSVSHAGNNACVCLSKYVTVGIDIENILPKVAAFYQSNFTIAEREWVDRVGVSEQVGRDWLYTLLWTVKEAALKARAVVHKNPWGFTGVGVDGLPLPWDLLSATVTGNWGDYFGLFTAWIEEQHVSTPVQVAFAATSHLIVTLVRRLPVLAPDEIGRSYSS
jgi:4'-phosphopantetheinyl transferase EntD